MTWNSEIEAYLVPRNMDEACLFPPPMFDGIGRLFAAKDGAAPEAWEPYPGLDGAYYSVPYDEVQAILRRSMGFMRPAPRAGVVERVMLERRSTCGTDPVDDPFTPCSRLDRAWSSNIESFRDADGIAAIRNDESVRIFVRLDGEGELWQSSFPEDEGFNPGARVRVMAKRTLERVAEDGEP